MKIHAHILAWNEAKILPFILDHYSKFVKKVICIVKSFWFSKKTGRIPSIRPLKRQKPDLFGYMIICQMKRQLTRILGIFIDIARTCLPGRTAERSGILVVGGAVVELDSEGHAFAKMGTVQYLHELAAHFGIVHFFAPARAKERTIYTSRLGNCIVFHPLLHMDKSGLRQIHALYHDLRCICKIGLRAEAALEFFPFAGGLIGSLFLRTVSARYGLYFGTDPVVPLSTIVGTCSILRQLGKRFASQVSSALADFVLVRDPCQIKRYSFHLQDRIQLSAPISALPRPTSIRLNRCQREEVKLLYVGMFSRRKGLGDLLRVVSVLARDPRRRYRLLLVGAPEMLGDDSYSLDQLRGLCGSMNINHIVDFHGYLDNIKDFQDIYDSADVFVLASCREGFPRVIEEALLYGLPVVAFKLASLAEVLRNGRDALLVEPGDSCGFVRAVKSVVNDSALRALLITNGHRLMESRFPVQASVQHAALLSGINGRQPSSRGT